MRRRVFALLIVIFILLPLTGNSVAGPNAPQSASFTSAMQAADFANAQFESVWSRTDLPVSRGEASRTWVWGPRLGEARAEPFAGAPGGLRTVQYFEKARMELNPDVSDSVSQWSVTTGLLVVELTAGQLQTGPESFEKFPPAELPAAGDAVMGTPLDTAPRYSSFAAIASLPGTNGRGVPSAVESEVRATIDRSGKVAALAAEEVPVRASYSAYAPEMGHNVPDVFTRFMLRKGLIHEAGKLRQDKLYDPVYLLGYPITEAYGTTVPIAGKATRVLVQLYQRRVLTYIPSFAEGWQVQMGNVGQHYHEWRYGQDGQAPGAGSPSARGSFVRAVGNRLELEGQTVTLKGTNYWLHNAPFGDTWIWWDAPLIKKELARAKELGVNTVRIGIPFGERRATKVIWGPDCEDDSVTPCSVVKGRIVSQMTQLLQIAAGYDMKVLFTLFEWNDDFPSPGQPKYDRQLSYLRGLVAPFANDDRVLAWDLHNAPEHYATWRGGGQDKVIAWAAHMAAALRMIDRNHMVTVGVANYETLFVKARDGRKLIDIVDLASFHSYDAGALRTQIGALERLTSKPLLLEEMGWPTGPPELSSPAAKYDDATQLFLYRTMLGDAKASTLVGVMQWMLWDYPAHYDRFEGDAISFEPYFGLVRLDGSLKPAAVEFREAYRSPPLPSHTKTNFPLVRQDGDE